MSLGSKSSGNTRCLFTTCATLNFLNASITFVACQEYWSDPQSRQVNNIDEHKSIIFELYRADFSAHTTDQGGIRIYLFFGVCLEAISMEKRHLKFVWLIWIFVNAKKHGRLPNPSLIKLHCLRIDISGLGKPLTILAVKIAYSRIRYCERSN